MTDKSLNKESENIEQAEIARYTPKERSDYEDSLKVYRDMKNVLDTAELKGMKRGLEKGRREGMEKGARAANISNAKKMLEMGLPWETITNITGLTKEDLS